MEQNTGVKTTVNESNEKRREGNERTLQREAAAPDHTVRKRGVPSRFFA